MSNHAIRVRIERYTGSTITTQSRHYSDKMHREADTARIKPRSKQSTHDLKHACNAAKITDSINMNDTTRQQRLSRRAAR